MGRVKGGAGDGYGQNAFEAILKELVQTRLFKKSIVNDVIRHPLDHELLCNGVFPGTRS